MAPGRWTELQWWGVPSGVWALAGRGEAGAVLVRDADGWWCWLASDGDRLLGRGRHPLRGAAASDAETAMEAAT